MSDLVAELAERGRSLSPEDRSRLVDLLLDSLHTFQDDDTEEAWRSEIRRRVDAYKRGDATLLDADDVLKEAKRLAP